MPARVRPERVGQEIQAAVADLLLRGMIRDPRVGFITVTGCKVTPDLRTARVFWSMIGTDEEKKACAAGLQKARGFVRREVTSRVKLRVSPEIVFSFDESVGEGDKIDRLLREVKAKEGW